MRRSIYIFLVIALIASGCRKSADEIKRSSILAKINDKIITLGEFEDYFDYRVGNYIEGLNEEQMRDLKYNMLHDLIDEEIILDIAKKEKIHVDELQIEEEVNRLISQYGDEQECNAYLKSMPLI